MKNSLLLILLVSGFTAVAQQPQIRLLKPNQLQGDTSITDQYKKLLDLARSQKALALATYSHSTSRGKIYILPGDHMPCLVPDMKLVTPMPGNYGPFPGSRMPNAIPESPLIPKGR